MLSGISILVLFATALGVEPFQAAVPRAADGDWTSRLPKRQPVAGLTGFESVSVVRYASAPDDEHELTCLYVFPARARWQITVRGKPDLGRHVEYRCGDAYFELAQSSERSSQVGASEAEAKQRVAKCELFELRRAAFLWPDGFEWKGEGASRRARTDCGRAVIAILGLDGRPASMSFEPAPAHGEESIHIRAWRIRQDRWWPEVLEFRQGTNLVWSEHVESLTSRLALLDSYFVPPDRREPANAPREARVLHFDAPTQHEIRLALNRAPDWATAARSWEDLRRRVAAELPTGWSCLPGACFELDDRGAPAAAIVRLRGTGTPPSGASTTPTEQALTTTEPWPGANLTGARDRLRGSTPPDAAVKHVLLLFAGSVEDAANVQVVAILRATR